MTSYQKFLRAALFEVQKPGLGFSPTVSAIAARAGMTVAEAQQHAEKMVRDGHARFPSWQPGGLLFSRQEITFALSTSAF